jgi:hypothetical protein
MNRHMAASAFPTGLKAQTAVRSRGLVVEAGVALQAELSAFPPYQQHAIGAAVGIVADHASFHSQSRMFVNIGPAFLHVALDAGLPVGGIQGGTIDASVRVMTIGTLQEALRNSMMHRQGELSLDIAVTAKAQIRLRFFEEAVVQPARCFGKLRHLEKGRLRQRGATPALIFNHFHQVDRVAFAAGNARGGML